MAIHEHLRASRRLGKLAAAILRARWEAGGLSHPAERATWQQRQALRMLSALEVDVHSTGPIPATGLIVCNHLGYLDILAIASQAPVVFVAKSDVRFWPLIGSLLESAGTILTERGRPLTAGNTGRQIEAALRAGLPVVLFPEGTSSDGSRVLPFKPTLLQPALDTSSHIIPATIRHDADGGDPATDVCYWGDASFPFHLRRLAALPKVRTRLHFGEAATLPTDRKEASKILRSTISEMLAAPAGSFC